MDIYPGLITAFSSEWVYEKMIPKHSAGFFNSFGRVRHMKEGIVIQTGEEGDISIMNGGSEPVELEMETRKYGIKKIKIEPFGFHREKLSGGR